MRVRLGTTISAKPDDVRSASGCIHSYVTHASYDGEGSESLVHLHERVCGFGSLPCRLYKIMHSAACVYRCSGIS